MQGAEKYLKKETKVWLIVLYALCWASCDVGGYFLKDRFGSLCVMRDFD